MKVITIIENVLQLNGLSIEILERLSYRSQLGKSLKQNLHYFDKRALMQELSAMVKWLQMQTILEDISLDFRIKSIASIKQKYERYYPNRQIKQVFNDILGFRAFCDDYGQLIYCDTSSVDLRIVDMSKGKAVDDGYRGVHVYYQKDNFHYPIEIQFNTIYDRQINNWLHDYLYKKDYPDKIGKNMRYLYETGKIKSAKDFEEMLRDELLHNC